MDVKLTLDDNFIKGYARLLSVFQTNEYPDLDDGWNKDYQALREDWAVVGKAIEEATGQFKRSATS